MDNGMYSRQVFNILSLFGTIGGILEIFMFVAELIMSPISEHAFLCSAISTFYLVKHSSEQNLFSTEVVRKNKGNNYLAKSKNNKD